jgi:hypothetical protein
MGNGEWKARRSAWLAEGSANIADTGGGMLIMAEMATTLMGSQMMAAVELRARPRLERGDARVEPRAAAQRSYPSRSTFRQAFF